MVQGVHLHLRSAHGRMVGITHCFRQLLESNRHLRGRERSAHAEKCQFLLRLPGQFVPPLFIFFVRI